jgi:hypothetical protein
MPHRQVPILRHGPVVDIIVTVDAVRAHALRAAGQPLPQVPLHALIDTGADCTLIDTSHLPFLNP